MEKQDLRERIILKELTNCEMGVSPLELDLIPREQRIDEGTYEITRERLSTLLYSFER